MRSFLAGIVATLVALLVLGFAAVQTGAVPANADRGALPGEKWAAHTSLDATIAREAPKDPPTAMNDADLAAGATLYVQNCAVCHGTAHSTPNAIERGLYISAPQFAKHDVTDDPIGVTYWKVDHGIAWTAMPSYHATLSERDRWQVAWFLKHQNALDGRAKAIWENPDLAPAATPLPAPPPREAGTPT